MTVYKNTNVVAKSGVNFVRSVVEQSGSLFHKIEQENDLGIDGIIEIIRNERPLNKQVAVQIKSGQSYYRPASNECVIPIRDHRDYWLHHPLPVIGIVYPRVPDNDVAYWVDIQVYLKRHPEATTICYVPSEANRFDERAFSRILVPIVLNEVPNLDFPEALNHFRSSKSDEFHVGLAVLFRRYPNCRETWEALIRHFIEQEPTDIPAKMIYYLAHVPGHPDICYIGETASEDTLAYAKALFSCFGRQEVLKLLGFIDEQHLISRGSVGQSVEAIISSLPGIAEILESIVLDESIDEFRRNCAAVILAINEGSSALPTLKRLAERGSWEAQALIDELASYGAVDPY